MNAKHLSCVIVLDIEIRLQTWRSRGAGFISDKRMEFCSSQDCSDLLCCPRRGAGFISDKRMEFCSSQDCSDLLCCPRLSNSTSIGGACFEGNTAWTWTWPPTTIQCWC